MACLDMFNTEHQSLCSSMSSTTPRISFSNDFVDTQQAIKHEIRSSRSEAPTSSDFEFSVQANYTMPSTADELFFKGRLLPFKDDKIKTTLRDELLVDDDDDVDVYDINGVPSSRPPKGPTRWKELLGLKRANNVMKKADHKSEESMEKTEAQGSTGSRLVHMEVDLSEISDVRREIEIQM